MIIFGSRATHIGSFEIADSTCDYCDAPGMQRIVVYGRYAHIFWIPLFPLGRKAVSECMHCRHTIAKREFSTELKEKYTRDKAQVGRPIWHWAGIGVIALLFGFGFIMAAIGAIAR